MPRPSFALAARIVAGIEVQTVSSSSSSCLILGIVPTARSAAAAGVGVGVATTVARPTGGLMSGDSSTRTPAAIGGRRLASAS